jgi:hypothetical protein
MKSVSFVLHNYTGWPVLETVQFEEDPSRKKVMACYLHCKVPIIRENDANEALTKVYAFFQNLVTKYPVLDLNVSCVAIEDNFTLKYITTEGAAVRTLLTVFSTQLCCTSLFSQFK